MEDELTGSCVTRGRDENRFLVGKR